MITVEIPPHMNDYRTARIKAGFSSKICIDPCIYNEIDELWNNGIITLGSCCGHNKTESFVNVDDSCIDKMIGLGYKMNHPDKDRRDTFELKSVRWDKDEIPEATVLLPDVSGCYSDNPLTDEEYHNYMSKKCRTIKTITYPDGAKGELNKGGMMLL